MTELLLDERPLVIQPSLVQRLGIAEAAIVQQLHYWAQRATNVHDGYRWVYKTYADWSDEIGLSTKAIRGALDRLRRGGIVVGIESPIDSRDRTIWWRIDYEILDPDPGSPSAPEGSPSARGGSSRAGVPSSTETTSETTKVEEWARDPRESPPEDFPDQLRPHAREVYRVLKVVAEQHGARRVWPQAVGRVLMAHPRHPLVAQAHALAAWAVDPPRPIKDVVGTYRSFLARERELEATEHLAPDGTPASSNGKLPAGVTPIRGRRTEEDQRFIQHAMAEAERIRELDSAGD